MHTYVEESLKDRISREVSEQLVEMKKEVKDDVTDQLNEVTDMLTDQCKEQMNAELKGVRKDVKNEVKNDVLKDALAFQSIYAWVLKRAKEEQDDANEEQEEQEELGGGLDFVADEPAVHEPVRRREPEPRPDPLESAIRALERTPIRQAAFVPTPRGPDPDPDPDPGRGVVARLEVPRDGVGRTSVLPFIVALFLLTWAGLGPN